MIKNNLIVLLIVSIGLMAIISGCTGGQDVTSVVKALPEVQQFMNEHPNAKITVTYWSKEEVTQALQEISQQCDKPITPVAMYKATVNEGDLKIISWINAENQIAICSITQGSSGSQITTPTPITPTPTTTTSTIAPTASIVASNNLDTQGVDLKIMHKGGDTLKAGEWKLSIVNVGNPPSYKASNSDFSVGENIISTTTTCDSATITDQSVIGCSAFSTNTKYDVKLVHIPSNGLLLDQVVEVRGSTEAIGENLVVEAVDGINGGGILTDLNIIIKVAAGGSAMDLSKVLLKINSQNYNYTNAEPTGNQFRIWVLRQEGTGLGTETNNYSASANPSLDSGALARVDVNVSGLGLAQRKTITISMTPEKGATLNLPLTLPAFTTTGAFAIYP